MSMVEDTGSNPFSGASQSLIKFIQDIYKGMTVANNINSTTTYLGRIEGVG